MKILSSYQHDALARQCGEAIWIKEIDPNQRINNKEEFHQPGDVEISYTKNDKQLKEKRKQNPVIAQEQEIHKETKKMKCRVIAGHMVLAVEGVKGTSSSINQKKMRSK